MNPALIHLLIILGGVAVVLATLRWFARVSGGWYSLAGFLAMTLLGVGAVLILAGFGVGNFPELTP